MFVRHVTKLFIKTHVTKLFIKTLVARLFIKTTGYVLTITISFLKQVGGEEEEKQRPMPRSPFSRALRQPSCLCCKLAKPCIIKSFHVGSVF